MVTVSHFPPMECWIWQIYFTKTQRTFSVTMYSSDLFSLDDEVLYDESIMAAKDPATQLWVHLIKISRLIRNPVGDLVL